MLQRIKVIGDELAVLDNASTDEISDLRRQIGSLGIQLDIAVKKLKDGQEPQKSKLVAERAELLTKTKEVKQRFPALDIAALPEVLQNWVRSMRPHPLILWISNDQTVFLAKHPGGDYYRSGSGTRYAPARYELRSCPLMRILKAHTGRLSRQMFDGLVNEGELMSLEL